MAKTTSEIDENDGDSGGGKFSFDFSSISDDLIDKVQKEIDDERTALNFDTKTKKIRPADNLTRTLLRVHAMFTEMRRHSPMAYIALISEMRTTGDMINFDHDPFNERSSMPNSDFLTKTELICEEGDYEIIGDQVVGKFTVQRGKMSTLKDRLIICGAQPDTNFNFWQKFDLQEVLQTSDIPFVGYAVVDDEPDSVYLNILPRGEYDAMLLEFKDAIKSLPYYTHMDAYMDHHYTVDKKFIDVADIFGLRHWRCNQMYHFSLMHPWLFDLYCAVAKKVACQDNAISPIYMIRDYMKKNSRIVMPIDEFMLGDTNIDGSALCPNLVGVGHPAAVYTQCNRERCTCYNPFRGRDFRSVLNRVFYKHLSISEYRCEGEVRVGYVFSADSNPNCIYCKGARGACLCKDDYRTALFLRDSPVTSAVQVVYIVNPPVKMAQNIKKYDVRFINNLDEFEPAQGAKINIVVPDGAIVEQFIQPQSQFIIDFLNQISVYSFAPDMMKGLLDADEEYLTGLLTVMNKVVDVKQPLNRSVMAASDPEYRRITDMKKTFEDIAKRKAKQQRNHILSMVTNKTRISQKVKLINQDGVMMHKRKKIDKKFNNMMATNAERELVKRQFQRKHQKKEKEKTSTKQHNDRIQFVKSMHHPRSPDGPPPNYQPKSPDGPAPTTYQAPASPNYNPNSP
jgi:hypothetical protein